MTSVDLYLIEKFVSDVTKSQLFELYRQIESRGTVSRRTFLELFTDITDRDHLTEENSRLLSMMFDQADTNGDEMIAWDDISALLVDTISVAQRRNDLVLLHDVWMQCEFSDQTVHSGKKFRWEDVSNMWYLRGGSRKYIASMGNDLVVFSVKSDTGTVNVDLFLVGHQSPVTQIHYIASTRRLLSCAADRQLIVWLDSDKWPLEMRLKTPSAVICLAYDDAAKHILGGSSDGNMYVVGVGATSLWLKQIVHIHNFWVMDICVMGMMDTIATCSLDGIIKIWDRTTFAFRSEKKRLDKGLTHMIYSASNKTFFTTSSGRKFYVWSLFAKAATHCVEDKHEKSILSMIHYPSDKQMVTVDAGGKINIWDLRTLTVLQSLGGPESSNPIGEIKMCAYNCDANELVTVVGSNLLVFPTAEQNFDQLISEAVTIVMYNFVFSMMVTVIGKRVIAWYIATGYTHAVYEHLSSCDILGLCMSAQGRDVALINIEGAFVVANVLTGQIEHQLTLMEPANHIFLLSNNMKQVRAFILNSKGAHTLESISPYAVVSVTGAVTVLYTAGTKTHGILSEFRTGVRSPSSVSCCRSTHCLALADETHFEVWDMEHCTIRVQRQITAALGQGSSLATIEFVEDLNAMFVVLQSGCVILYGLHSPWEPLIRFETNVKNVLSVGWNLANWSVTFFSPHQGVVSILDMAPLVLAAQQSMVTSTMLRKDSITKYRSDRYHVAVNGDGFMRRGFDTQTNLPICVFVSPTKNCTKEREALLERVGRLMEGHTKSANLLHVIDTFTTLNPESLLIVRENFMKDPIHHLSEMRLKSTDTNSLHNEVTWVLRCVLSGLAEAHERGEVVALFAAAHIQLNGTRWKLVCPDGLYHVGETFSAEASGIAPNCFPPMLCKNRTVALHPSFDMWHVGLLAFELITGRPLLSPGISLDELEYKVNHFECLTTKQDMQRQAPQLATPELVSLTIACLQNDPTKRPTAKELRETISDRPPMWTTTPVFPKVDTVPDGTVNNDHFTYTYEQVSSFMSTYAPTKERGNIVAIRTLTQHPLFITAAWNGYSSTLTLHRIKDGAVVGTLPRGTRSQTMWSFVQYRHGHHLSRDAMFLGPREMRTKEYILGRASSPKANSVKAKKLKPLSKEEQSQQEGVSCTSPHNLMSGLCPFFTSMQDGGYKQQRATPFYMQHSPHEHLVSFFPAQMHMQRWKPKTDASTFKKPLESLLYPRRNDDITKEIPEKDVVGDAHYRRQRLQDQSLMMSTEGLITQVLKIAPIDKSLFRRPLSRNDLIDMRGGVEVDNAGGSYRVSDTIKQMELRKFQGGCAQGGGAGGRTVSDYLGLTQENYKQMREQCRRAREGVIRKMLESEKETLKEKFGGVAKTLFQSRRRSGAPTM